jgi:hypothetical protein
MFSSLGEDFIMKISMTRTDQNNKQYRLKRTGESGFVDHFQPSALACGGK